MEVNQGGYGAMGRSENDYHQGDTEGASNLSCRLIYGATYRKSLFGKARDRRCAQNWKGEADAEAGDDGSREPKGEVFGV